MAPHSSTLAWKIQWTEEPGRQQSMGSLGVRHDWATSLSRIGEGNSNPLQCSCLEEPRDGGASWAAVYGVTQSQTWLKRLSSSSLSSLFDLKLRCWICDIKTLSRATIYYCGQAWLYNLAVRNEKNCRKETICTSCSHSGKKLFS